MARKSSRGKGSEVVLVWVGVLTGGVGKSGYWRESSMIELRSSVAAEVLGFMAVEDYRLDGFDVFLPPPFKGFSPGNLLWKSSIAS